MARDASDVVEWGSDDQPRLAAVAARLRVKEQHLRRAIAGAGAGLAFLSLITDWQATAAGGDPVAMAHTTIAGLGSLGTGYLVGLMVLATLCATTLFGPPAVRPLLRIAALGWAGAVLGVLMATAVTLSGGPRSTVPYGPGVLLAIGGVVLLALAVYLTDRTRPHPVPVERPEVTPPPADLSVTPVKPFVHLPEQR